VNILAFLLLLTSSCAHTVKCTNSESSHVVLDDTSCRIRIRQVVIGDDIIIPKNTSRPALSDFKLDWVESSIIDGKVNLGHFMLVPGGAP
jgi:hypothetical protein